MTIIDDIGPALAWVRIDLQQGDVIHLPVCEHVIAHGLQDGLHPGVAWHPEILPAHQKHLAYLAEVIAYAINEGKVTADTTTADETVIAWRVHPDDIAILRQYGVID